MALSSGNVSVSTTATLLTTTDTAAGGGLAGNALLVKNPSGSVTVYIGGAAVTADANADTGGYPLAPGGELAISVGDGELVYARVAASTQSVNVLRQGV